VAGGKQDPLDLGGRRRAQAQGRLEAFGAELARIEGSAQLIQGRVILLANLVASGLEQDQVARAVEQRGHAHEGLAGVRLQAGGTEDDGLAVLQAFSDRRLQQLLGTFLQLLLGDPSAQEAADLLDREQRCPVLDQTLEKALALGNRGRDHDEQAARGIAQAVNRREHAAVNREVGRPRGRPVTAGTI